MLIILRHTLEHIKAPDKFLFNLFQIFNSKKYRNIPIFIEVPDVDWIFENKCYWDFFYEHVNYFSKHSLFNCIKDAGASVKSISNDFGGQYLWAEALINPTSVTENNPFSLVKYPENHFYEVVSRVNIEIEKLKIFSKVVVWGMASKGIIFTLNCSSGIDFCVDINKAKQHMYIPKMGLQIVPPEELPQGIRLSVICMNPNYYKEIYNTCIDLKLDFELYSPEIIKMNYHE